MVRVLRVFPVGVRVVRGVPHEALDELLERLESGDADVVGQSEDLDGAVVGAERHDVLPRGVERQATPRRGLKSKVII